MALTFRSTGVTEVVIVERDADGATRLARAVQSDHNPRQWNATVEHPTPSGPNVRPCSNIYGSRDDANAALAHFLHETRLDYTQEKARGFRPAAVPRDTNQRLDELGQPIGAAPVQGIHKR